MDKYIAEGKDKEVEGIFALFENLVWKILMLNTISRIFIWRSATFNFMDLDGIPYVVYVWKRTMVLNNF